MKLASILVVFALVLLPTFTGGALLIYQGLTRRANGKARAPVDPKRQRVISKYKRLARTVFWSYLSVSAIAAIWMVYELFGAPTIDARAAAIIVWSALVFGIAFAMSVRYMSRNTRRILAGLPPPEPGAEQRDRDEWKAKYYDAVGDTLPKFLGLTVLAAIGITAVWTFGLMIIVFSSR